MAPPSDDKTAGVGWGVGITPSRGRTLTVPQVGNWLSANDREHPMKRARRVKEWRTAAGWLGRDVGAVETPVHVTFVFKRRSSRRWDVENLAPTAKAIMDGLRDAGVLPDDDTTNVPVVTFRSAVGPPSVDVIMERPAPDLARQCPQCLAIQRGASDGRTTSR
jgi:crossover junction endodeoxyribonuclease RusA